MALIGMRDVCWGFGDPPLLENITLQIEKGERVCLLGRNGLGKSTLLKLFAGEILPDRGDVWRHSGVSVAAMVQDVSPGCSGTVFDVIAQGFGETGGTLVEYNRICKTPETSDPPEHANRRDELLRMLDTEDGGEGNDFIIFNGQKRHVISYLQDFLFAPERCRTPVYVLSGGEKNRLMLAKLFTAPANVLAGIRAAGAL